MRLLAVVGASLLGLTAPLVGQPAGDVLWPDAVALEDFLERAKVVKLVKIGTGVTDSHKVELVLDGQVHQAIFKKIDSTHDSWKREVAAYELDKLLGVRMVPPTVERSIRGRRGCLQLWIDGQALDELDAPPADLHSWRRQIAVMWLFDELSGNTDRHLNNIVVAPGHRVVLIDNSRAFKSHEELLHDLNLADTSTRARFWWDEYEPERGTFATEFREEVVSRLETLDNRSVKLALGRYIDGNLRKKMLVRRDALVQKLGAD